MDPAQLTTPGFWEAQTCHVMVNDRDMAAVVQAETIHHGCQENNDFHGHLLFSTSGSTGAGKWVALSRRALLASAQAVNEHLGVSNDDHWMLALPTFHVGGMGIAARAYLAGCAMSVYESVWDAREFHKLLQSGVTLTSLVPTQLTDLVVARLSAPESLRVVLIGGGALDETIYEKAVELGWPVVETYGMTEACSQIATATLGDRTLRLLPCWQAKTDVSGVLAIKGEPLFSGYLTWEHGRVMLEAAAHDGWFVTNDRVDMVDDVLVFHGRVDRAVKVLGELVDLAGVESQLQKLLDGKQVAVVAMPDQRRGSRLYAFTEGQAEADELSEAMRTYHQTCIPVARMESIACLEKLPRTALGKIRYSGLIDRVSDDIIG